MQNGPEDRESYKEVARKKKDTNPEQDAQDENQNEVDEGEPGESEMSQDDQKLDDPATSTNAQARKRSRRQSGEVLWEDDHFPPCSKFQPPTKLPTLRSVVGRFRFLTAGGKHQMSRDLAIKQVTLEVESKYYHDTICCIPERTIERRLEKILVTYKAGKKRLMEGGRDKDMVVKDYKQLILDKDKLFDVVTTCPDQ